MTSPIYFHPRIYEALMRLLYRKGYRERIAATAALIPDEVSIADLCAGDCSLYRYGLRGRTLRYTAYDINLRFQHWANRRKIPFQRLDLRRENPPSADYIVLMSSLYQFIPEETFILEKLSQAAGKCLILTEPVHNVAQSSIPFIGWLGKKLTRVGDHPCEQRFTKEQLVPLLGEFGFQMITPIAREREILAVLRKTDDVIT